MTEKQRVADALHSDRRVRDAKRELCRALAEHSATLSEIRPPDPARESSYQAALDAFAKQRGGALFYPYLASGVGNGVFVELADGSVKYDLIGGIGVHYFGHSHPELAEWLIDAALSDTVMQGNLQQGVDSAELSSDLCALATRGGAPLAHCFLTTSGAMANENALKLALHARAPADRVLAFENAFAGRSLAMAAITDNAAYRSGLPLVLAVDYVPFFESEDPEGSRARTLARTREHLARHKGRYAAMIIELVQGEGGYHPGDPGLFRDLCELLREHDVTIMFDEIQTFGRTTEPFAFQAFGLGEYADLVTVGKTLQVCATLFRSELLPPPGLVSQTFTGSTASIAAARFVTKAFASGRLFGEGGRVAEVAERFARGFEAIRARHPEWIRGPWGCGSMLALTPFSGERGTTKRLLDLLFSRGVIAFATGGPLARLRFLPPVAVIRDEEIAAVLEILETSLAVVASEGASE